MGEEGVGKVPNIPEGLWLEERWGRGEEGKGPTGNRLGKGLIKSGILSDGRFRLDSKQHFDLEVGGREWRGIAIVSLVHA